MLKLKRLEMQGFKSFPDRTELRFNGSGIAAIVGPNGCGKSNIADAINWVLGEQSAKSLRGARMEDVIFAGTRDRKPVGLAQVTVTMVDPGFHFAELAAKANGGANGVANGAANGKANGAANGVAANGAANGKGAGHGEKEITITRRLFRSGESEYLIDGRAARLRDIQDIFMGTGLGPESYAIIEQGRIGQLLSSRPQDRRAVIEEAAGISKFKSRRKLAEARLEGAKHNLERVFDILEEVGRQANSLKRQASKARRYEELKAEMDAQLRRVLAARHQSLEREAAKIALDLNAATAAFDALSAEAAQKEQEYSRSQAEGYQTEEQLTEARKRLAELNLELERTRGRLDYQAKQIASIEQRLAQGESESQEIESRAGRVREELEAHSRTVAERNLQAGEARQRLEAKARERDALQASLGERERGLESSRQAVLRLLGEASALRNQLAQIDAYMAALDRDAAKTQKEEQTASADIEWLTASKNELTAKRSARQMELESTADQRRRVESELAARKKELGEARRELEAARAEFSRLKARRDSLEEILSHRAYTTDSVKRLFGAIERGQASELRPLGVLADFVEVEPAYEKAAEEFLHDELEYIVVQDWQQAECGIEVMRSSLEGRATFLVHPEQGTEPAAARPAEPPEGTEGIAARLSQVLRLTNGFSNTALECLPRVSRCFVVNDRAAAQRLARQYPDLYFLLPDGVCYHGHAVSGGKKTSSGPLALKRELRETMALVQARQKVLDETAARIQNLEREIARLEQEIERLRGAQQAQERETLALDHEMRKVAEELNRANSRLSVARLELDRLSKERERSAERRQQNQAAVEQKERARNELEQALEAARNELEGLKSAATRAGEEHSALRAELAGLEERQRADRATLARLESQIQELTKRGKEIAGDLERLGVERARLLANNIELDERAAVLADSKARAEAEVAGLAEREVNLRAALAGLEESLKQLRTSLQTAQENRSHIEVELVKRQAELKFLDETCRNELGIPIAELETGSEPPLDAEGLAEIENKFQELKRRIEALGPVNPEALSEYQLAQQRYEFLNTQRQDLLDSIRDLEKAIHEIDVESKKRFSEAFAAINNYFRDLFATLFNGGTGEMRLTDEENVNESGIDIVASPPGKRLQNVLLLSGGEKALTALALLMAIFKYSPSPFCILDEVDAPLDDPNIARLTRLVREMSKQTQFIVITHAKRTMEAAEALYGVTMQEPGVSRLVSVKFNPTPPPPPQPQPQQIATA
ncbi:MAG: chromosome segregation protein SMC [Rhodospirillales bacterium]